MIRRKLVPVFMVGALLLALVPDVGHCGAYDQLRSIAGEPGKVPEPGAPVCVANCGGSSSDSSSNEEREPYDITRAPIFVAPVGFIGGVFMGAGWYFGEMAGKYPDIGFLKSYGNYMSVNTGDSMTDKPFNFGARLGALPWLALYVPSWPIRQGIAAIADVATRPSPHKPVDPRVAGYEAVARNYADLKQSAAVELTKIDNDIALAELRRTAFIDRFINDREELRAIRQEQGVEAARAKAARQLDAWSKSRAERAQLTLNAQLANQEKDAFCRAAMDAAYKSLAGSFFDLTMSGLEDKLDGLPEGIKEAHAREKLVTKAITKGKTAIESLLVLKEMKESYNRAKENDQAFVQWYTDKETRGKLMDLALKVMPEAVKSTPAVGQAVSAAGGLMDAGYAVTANYLYAGQVAEQVAILEKLRSATIFSDAMADDWDRINMPVKAAREREKKARELIDYYERQRKENADHAKKLRG